MPKEGALGREPVWMLVAVLTLLMNICQAEHEITVEPPRNVQIIDPGHLGELYITWEVPASLENRTDCTVRFQLQFFNTYEDEWTTIRTRERSYSAQFDLEKDVRVSVLTILGGRCSGFKVVQSPAVEVLLKPPAIGSTVDKMKDLSCIFYEKEYMDCTWPRRHKKAAQVKYHLYFWHRKMNRAKECPEYIRSHGHRSGCRFARHSLEEFTEFNICVNGSLAGTQLQPAYFTMQVQNHVKPGVINALSLETYPKGAVSLRWAPPKGKIPVKCLEFEVESRPKDTERPMMTYLTRDSSFMVSLTGQCNGVCLRVRSRVHEYCSDESIWSEWSDPRCFSENCQFESGSASNKA